MNFFEGNKLISQRKFVTLRKILVIIITAASFQKCAAGPKRETYDTQAQYDAKAKEINALAAKPSVESLKILLPYLRSENKNSRAMAAYALHHFAAYLEHALPDVEQALSDPEWRVRAGTLAAVYYMGEKGAPHLPVVRKLVSDPEGNVSANAFSALHAVSGGKEGGCAMTEERRQQLSLKAPEIPKGTALIFGNVGCAHTNDAIHLVKKMNLKYELYDLYRNPENMDILFAHLSKLRIKNYRTIPVVIYDGRVFEKPQKDGDIFSQK